MRSISFVAEGDVNTLVTVTDNGDGTLTFDIRVIGATVGDLRAIFFDLNDGFVAAEGDLYIADGGSDVTDMASGEGSIDTLGKDANIKGSVSNELGDFDVGIEFGTSGMAGDDIQSASFTLASYSTDLSLDMLDFADFGFRYTSVGDEGGDRTASAKIGDTAGGTASDDAIAVLEGESASLNLLANDQALGTVTAQVVVLESAAGVFGTLSIAADGTATLTADGAAADALNDGESASFIVSYEVTDGSNIATASVTVTIAGVTDEVLPGLFTEGADTVDFNTLAPGEYDPASFYDALGGNDRIVLPDAVAAAAIGFDLGEVFHSGGGLDTVTGSDGDDAVSFGERGWYSDQGGNDTVTGGSDMLNVYSGDGGDDLFDFGDGRDVLSYSYATSGVTVDLVNGTAGGAAGNDTIIGSVTDLQLTKYDDEAWTPDTVSPTNGYAIYLHDGNDIFHGGAQRDVLFMQTGTGSGHNTLDGGAGTDVLAFNGLSVGVDIDAAAGTYSGWGSADFTSFEEFHLGNGDNSFNGGEARETVLIREGNDTIAGNGGNDTILDGAGNSWIDAGAGDDWVHASTGFDHYEGGAGNDMLTLTQSALAAGVHLDLAAGLLTAADGSVSTVSGFEMVRDGIGDDTIIGSDNDDHLRGEFGNDNLTGGLGADTFWFIPANGRMGDNVITDFNAAEGDQLALFGVGNVLDYAEVGADVLLTVSDTGGTVLGTVTFLDTVLADLA